MQLTKTRLTKLRASLLRAAPAAVLAAGCATTATLTPAPSAEETGAAHAALAEVDGVNVIAQAQAWDGSRVVTDHVTPIQVRIENDRGEPLRLRYQDFALEGASGHRYAALPPFQVEGKDGEYRLAEGSLSVAAPTFYHHGFHLAPIYLPFYPGFSAASHYPFHFDPYFYDHYWGHWDTIELPTPAMLDQALPEGVLDARGEVEGFLYFEPVDERVARVTFRADLVNAESGEMFGEVRIPFVDSL